LRETILQTLETTNAETIIATSRDELMSSSQTLPDIILAEPFAFDEPGLDLMRELKLRAPAVPLIILLPFDTRDYRDAVVRIGANGVVAAEQLTTELLPTVERLLSRARLATSVADRINQFARTSSPMGESVLGSVNLRALSDETVERLAPLVPQVSALENVSPSETLEGRKFLRGLAVMPGYQPQRSETRVVRTACNLNCGSHFCGMNVTVRDGHIAKIEPGDFPDKTYRRVCLKGISYTQMIAHPDRLVYPLKQMGERGSQNWQRISWDQALDEIANKMRSVANRYEMKSTMFFPYTGQLGALNGVRGVYSRLASALGASATATDQYGVDSAVPSGIEDTFGKGSGYVANDFADLVNSKLILIWGTDPATSRMSWWHFFMQAKRAGARIVTIDPRFSVTASKSDEWLAIRPGTDLYLALAMLRLMIERNWIDEKFALRHTVAPLLVRTDNGRFLRSSDLLNKPRNGIGLVWDAQVQHVVASHDAVSPSLTGCFDVEGIECRTAFDLLREMLQPYTLALASEKTGLAADQIFALTRDYATMHPARLFTLYGVDRWHHGATFGRLIATLGALTGNVGIPGGCAGVDGFPSGAMFANEFARTSGKAHYGINPATLVNQIETGNPYPIKAMWVAFGNWLNQWPNQNRLLHHILPKLDLLVVADHFMTESARWADYVLPAAMFFEREDMVKGPFPFVQYQPAIVPPPGECRSDFDIAKALAQRLGCGDAFARSPRDYLADIFASDASTRGLSFDELQSRGILRCEIAPEQHLAHANRQFATPTGRIEFYNERLLTRGKALPVYEPPAEARLDGDQVRRFPFVCISDHSRYRVHSTFGGAPWLRELDREPCVLINPADASMRQIQDGDWVCVFNDRGYVVLRARLNQVIPQSAVYVSQGWQSRDYKAGHAQSLTHDMGNDANAFGPNTSFSDVLVNVVREEASHDG
jgi:molybdopterin-containing oxidoreductase family molybdopterin binding subunit